MLNNLKIGPKIMLGFGLALLALLIISAVAYLNTQTLYKNIGSVTHTNQVISQLELIESTLKDAETGQRGYIITGKEEYLEPYNEAVKNIDNVVGELQKLTNDNPTQQNRIDDLKPLITDKLNELKETIDLRRTAGFDAALAVVLTNKGKAVMDKIRQLIVEMENAEKDLMVTRNADAQNAYSSTITSIFAGTLVSFFVLLVVGLGIVRSITRPLQQVTAAAQHIADVDLHAMSMALNAMAKGDLNQKLVFSSDLLNIQSKDESGQLARAFNAMITSLQEASRAYGAMIDTQRTLMNEINRMSIEQNAGDLDAKINVDMFSGVYRDVASGIVSQVFEHIRIKRQIVDVADKYSQGNFSAQVEKLPGKKAFINETMDRVRHSLREMLMNITDASNNLGSASAEILAATTQQASGASEQSAAIAQTTTTVNEVKVISEQASARAMEVANASQRTVEVARSGQRSVKDTIESMNMIKDQVESISENLLALSDQTQQIGEIIASVNDIAAQSNMLALNASVEAARAGEHGKGFAVVAMEVRNLAEQSRQATAQIKSILSEIQKATNTTVMATEEGTKGVERGVQLAAQAQEAIQQLAAVINESAQIATQVVAGGQQQQTGIEQIALAMQNINQATIQSLASTRQAEKSAQNLNELARQMNELVAKYRK